ncbi:hypothetical protein EDD17DRAFT_1517282, partial [Pisolithus thermaeus]
GSEKMWSLLHISDEIPYTLVVKIQLCYTMVVKNGTTAHWLINYVTLLIGGPYFTCASQLCYTLVAKRWTTTHLLSMAQGISNGCCQLLKEHKGTVGADDRGQWVLWLGVGIGGCYQGEGETRREGEEGQERP